MSPPCPATSILTWSFVPRSLKLMMRLSSQTNELYQLAAVVFCLLSAWCSDKLGLSLELGSFMAGVMISTTDFAQHTLDQVEPIRNLFAALSLSIENLHYREAPVADLCLDFTLPGYPDYTLKPGDEIVDLNNLEDYISMVVDATAKTGITRQLEAFRAGFNQVFDVSSLQIFTPHELDYLLCGRRELWKTETLADHIKFDHGYTAKSPAIVNLLEIMGGFTPEQQRALCQFVTGAPKLPLGGLAVLNPKLTIVRKLSSTAVNTSYNGIVHSESADDDLPSVKACAPLEPNNSLDQSL
ncbi:E3 ubiquitin-protein ligase upl3 [Lathyrus oleraceus]|uniref:E3 ubiquitin-protein ligase upl3 n=1 Tax=Pisum sativum TaxID=3888 RepID=A0A9D4W5B4_PEA|nr:E3 ubiquitin-protein ligase upl3 [Pisum sativum]